MDEKFKDLWFDSEGIETSTSIEQVFVNEFTSFEMRAL